jgi:hypothetical protein
MIMSNQSPVRIVLANRPRLFRELLQHALDGKAAHKASRFQVTAVTDSVPAATVLEDVDWLIVDEETAASAVKVATANPDLKILSVEGRGHRLQYLANASPARWELVSSTPNLDDLVGILTQHTTEMQRTQS